MRYWVNTSHGRGACGAGDCLLVVHGDYFDLPVATQLEYLPLLSDWLVDAHREGIEALSRATSV